MPNEFESELINRLEKAREEIRILLRNKLTYPKTVLGALREGRVPDEKIFRMQDLIDESISLVDAKLNELIDEVRQ